MTTNDHSPPSIEDIDLWASRLVDGEVSTALVPESFRPAVLARAEEFTALRQRLLTTASVSEIDAGRRDRHIARALATSTTNGAVIKRLTRPRAALGVAASIVAVGAVSIVVLSQGTDGDKVQVADTMMQTSPSAFVGSRDSSEVVGANPESNLASGAEVAADSPIQQFSSIEDIAAFVANADLEAGDATVKGSDRTTSPRPCSLDNRVPRRRTLGFLAGRPVEVRIFSKIDFVVIDSATCAVLSDHARDK